MDITYLGMLMTVDYPFQTRLIFLAFVSYPQFHTKTVTLIQNTIKSLLTNAVICRTSPHTQKPQVTIPSDNL